MKILKMLGAVTLLAGLAVATPACQTKQLQQKIAGLEQEKQTLTQEKTDLGNKVTQLTEQVNSLQNQVTALTQDRDGLQKQVADMQAAASKGKGRKK